MGLLNGTWPIVVLMVLARELVIWVWPCGLQVRWSSMLLGFFVIMPVLRVMASQVYMSLEIGWINWLFYDFPNKPILPKYGQMDKRKMQQWSVGGWLQFPLFDLMCSRVLGKSFFDYCFLKKGPAGQAQTWPNKGTLGPNQGIIKEFII